MKEQFSRNKVSFVSEGQVCRGYLYVPVAKSQKGFPCVVIANGFSGTMDWILPSFAEAFSANGFAVLIFDYRHLGESEGIPRQLIDPDKQLKDLESAIAFARQQDLIDSSRIALWGTSLGGSYIFRIASRDSKIAAVIGNMPAIDAIKGSNLNAKLKHVRATRLDLVITSLKLLFAAVIDQVKALLGLDPYYIQVYGKPGKAFFADTSLGSRFETVQQESPTWQNKATPRFIFKAPRYKEGTFERVQAPILLTLAINDVELSADFIKSKAKGARHLEIKEYPFGHFDLYHGDVLETVLKDQVEFLKRVLVHN